MSAQIQDLCFKCEVTFKQDDHGTTKLQQSWDDGTKEKLDVPIFSGAGGTEALLWVEEEFRNVAEEFEFAEGEELFRKFERCLSGTAKAKWRNVTSENDYNINEVDADDFDEAMANFYLKCVDEEARDTMISCLDTEARCRIMLIVLRL